MRLIALGGKQRTAAIVVVTVMVVVGCADDSNPPAPTPEPAAIPAGADSMDALAKRAWEVARKGVLLGSSSNTSKDQIDPDQLAFWKEWATLFQPPDVPATERTDARDHPERTIDRFERALRKRYQGISDEEIAAFMRNANVSGVELIGQKPVGEVPGPQFSKWYWNLASPTHQLRMTLGVNQWQNRFYLVAIDDH